MKILWNRVARMTVLALAIAVLHGCMKMSELETDKSAGLNGGFEVSKNDLPVNWIMYTPNTVKNGDFSIAMDKTVFKEGKQSLRFDVKECADIGGWYSPGFTNEFFEIGKFEGKGTYKISLWIKNHGTKFRLRGGGVTAKTGHMEVLMESAERIDEWTYYAYKVDVLENNHLRLELNILAPGTFWIDNIEIVKQ